MKTKIIYISGAEVFNIADVRAAFEEVRAALSLGADTVLFGVPVDADTAIVPQTHSIDTAPAADAVADVPEPAPVPEETAEDVPEKVPVAPVVEDAPVVEEAPAPKKRGRARRTGAKDAPAADVADTPVAPDTPDAPDAPAADDAAPIPILSVLAAQAAVADVDDVDDVDQIDVVDDIDDIADADADEIVVDAAPIAAPDVSDADIDTVALADMITDEPPVESREKTLEELLATMAPLREDKGEETAADAENSDADDDDLIADAIGDTDATLEQLAAEFVQNEDKIVATPKASGRGKIGKLKNILPFKKAKRDENGLMGDLFGWAGIAANDDDFSIPGFFTPTAPKD